MNILKSIAFLSLATVLSACQTVTLDGPPNVRIYKDSSANQPYGLTISFELARTGKTSQRFEVRHGDCGRESDCHRDRRRVELSEGSNYHARISDKVWYGWSIYLPNNFRDVEPSNTHLGQGKFGETPLWAFNAHDNLLVFEYRPSTRTDPIWCTASKLSNMRGRWSDIVIYADYSYENKDGGNMLEVWINNKLVCKTDVPVMHPKRTRAEGQTHVQLRYGIYNSYISKFYNSKADILPTQVVYYDNMRTGKTRAEVEVDTNLN
jgi:hypothetical protein